MSTPLDQIANISITRTTPVVEGDSFGILMIVDTFLATKITDFGRSKAYYSIASMLTDTWTNTDEVVIQAKNAFAQNPPPNYIMVGRKDAGDADWGVALDAINDDNSSWFLLSTTETVAANLPVISAWAELNKKIALFDTSDLSTVNTAFNTSTSTDLGALLKITPKFNSVVNYHSAALKTAGERLSIALMMSQASATPGSITYKFKTPAGITADALTLSQKMNAWSRNVGTFTIVSAGNPGITENGMVSGGEWIDIMIFDYWLQTYLQQDLYAYLASTPKALMDDDGISGVQAKLQARCEKGADNGGLIKGSIKITVPKFADISDTDKQTRSLNGVKVYAEHKQAIHFVAVAGSLSA